MKGLSRDAVELEFPDCPLCGNNEVKLLFRGRDRLHNLPGTFGVSRCTRCGFVFTSPRPKDISVFYPDTYSPYQPKLKRRKPRNALHQIMLSGFKGYPGSRWASWLLLWPFWPLWRMGAKYCRVVPWVGEMRLFDFGCGAGNYLKSMQQMGCTVTGMDISEAAVSVCRANGLNVYQGTLPCPDISDNSFDVITMWQSLEHVTNPRAVIAEAYRILGPGGCLAIGVPLFDSFACKCFGPDWYHLDIPRHNSHFECFTLRRLLEEEGFNKISFRFQHRKKSYQKSLERYSERTGNKWAKILAHSNSFCRLLALFCWAMRSSDNTVVFARKMNSTNAS